MSFLNAKHPISAIPQQLNSINVDRSRYGDPVPLVYGMQRIPVTLLWYGAFTSIPQTTKTGGKGGGGKQLTSYNYTASCVMGLCEGPIIAIQQMWKDKSITTPALEGLVTFLGAGGQAVWSYLSTNFASQAVPYDHTAYLGAQNLALGSSAAIPNYTAEVQGFLSSPGAAITFTTGLAPGATSGTLTASVTNGIYDITFSDKETRSCTISGGVNVTWDPAFGLTLSCTANAVLGGYDADPSAIWLDYCTDANHGCNFNGTNSSVLQGAGNTYQTYCKANSLLISPWEDTQRSAASFLTDILEITNSDCVMSVGQLNVYPYCDVAVSGNGVTFTPNLTPLFAFSDDDYLLGSAGANSSSQSDDPVQLTRKPLTETYNVITVEFYDRSNNYNAALAEWKDDADIAVNGIRKMAVKTFHQITTSTVALQVASLIGQRQLYIRNVYSFAVRADLYSLLEPMDLISLTDSGLNISNKLCRIVQIDDDENDTFTITAEEMLVGTASAPKYSIQAQQGYYANYAVAPPAVYTPVIFSAPPALVTAAGGYELWLAVCGTVPTANYGGCNVYASMDNATWTYAGTITGESRIGTVSTSHPIGTTDTTIYLTLYPDSVQLDSSSSADFAANRALMYLDGEIIGFNVVTLISGQNYSVTVSRGLFGTNPVTHAVGAIFAQLDATIFRMPFDPGMIGQTIYLEFYAFNTVGQATLTSASTYPYLISNYGQGQLISGPLTLLTSGVAVNGTSAYKSSSTSGWSANFYSQQSYVNGAFCSWQPVQTNGNVMVGLATAPTAGNNYNVLNYAWYVESSGAILNIEELGVQTVTGLTYAVGDVLVITYDGFYARYLHNGTLVRQVAAPLNLTLYLDSCFFEQQTAVTGIEFGAFAAAQPALTLLGSALMAINGSTAFKNGGSNAWDSATYSSQSYINGAVASWRCLNTSDAFFVGLCSNPTASYSYTNLNYGFQCAAGTVDLYNSGSLIGSYGSYAAGDSFAITYDGSYVRYLHNGALIYQQIALPNQTLFLSSSFYNPGAIATSIEFAPYGTATPTLMIARGGCYVHDSLGYKYGGTANSWTTEDAYSVNAYTICNVVFKPTDLTSEVMIGMSSSGVSLTPAYGTAGLYLIYLGSGIAYIYESGTNVATIGTYAITDRFSMTYDGSNIRYYYNGVLQRTIALSAALIIAYTNFYSAGAGFNSFDFGPGVTVPFIDTTGLGSNAATVTGSASTTSASVGSNTTTHLANNLSITVGPFPYATSVVLDADASYTTVSAGFGTPIFINYGISTSSSSFSGNVNKQFSNPSPSSGVAQQGLLATEAIVTLAANTTQTYYFLSGMVPDETGVIGSGINLDYLVLKYEVIKR
jgi:Putative phage tail protein